jgi:selenide,water dikinase
MSRLNNTACRLAAEFDLRGGTDVTGFGLLGHAVELSEASGLALSIDSRRLPFLAGAHSYAAKGIFPGGAFDNQRDFGSRVRFSAGVDEPSRLLYFDPQTSGGLLLGVPSARVDEFLGRAEAVGQPAWVIGEAHTGTGIEVR